MALRNETNIVSTLFDRCNGTKRMSVTNLPVAATRRIDEAHKNITRSIKLLKTALKSKSWRQIENAVELIILKLLDNQNPDALFAITPSKRLERELFVQFGGMQLLLEVLEPPLSQADARHMASSQIQRHVELWNEVLVVLREVCFAVPSLADSIFSDQHLVFLFTLLSHEYVFENTMSLLEEVLAVRHETFCLCLVPDLYQLLGGFSTRRLAHFCRVLALLLFEPEDRQIMENAQVLRSYELLGLRRDRMSKRSSRDIERNQSLVLDMPGLLPRLLTLMRLANHGPSVSDLARGEGGGGGAEQLFEMGGMPGQQGAGAGAGGLTQEQLFMYHMHNASFSSPGAEWEHFDELEDSWRAAEEPSPPLPPPPAPPAAVSGPVPLPPSVTSTAPATSTSGPSATSTAAAATTTTTTGGGGVPRDATAAALLSTSLSSATATASTALSSLSSATSQLLLSTGGGDITDSAYFGLDDMDSDEDVSEQQQQQGGGGGGGGGPRGGQSMSEMRDQMQESLVSMLQALQPSLQMPPRPSSSSSTGPAASVAAATSSSLARGERELSFQAMALAPHQVELLFVLCTLLSGRRKMDVQNRLAALGLGDVLLRMFTRMSWDAPAFSGHNPLEHIHGPDCTCNPESALRVQYLRLVHNFTDRDFHNNPLPQLLLSPAEQREVSAAAPLSLAGVTWDEKEQEKEGEGDVASLLRDPSRGLLSKISRVLVSEPFDSVYRFWLSSCVEGFLRGTGPAEQGFVAREAGLLRHLVRHITGQAPSPSGSSSSSSAPSPVSSVSNLQTSFDLLGELVRYNPRVVEQLEALLLEGDMDREGEGGQGRGTDRFLGVVLSNLVDSNVFLRSLVLTVEKLGCRPTAEGAGGIDTVAPGGGSGSASGRGRDRDSAGSSVHHLPPSCQNPTGSPGGRGFTLVAAGVFPAGVLEEDHLSLITTASPPLSSSSSSSLSSLPPTPTTASSAGPVPVPVPVASVASVSYLTHSWLQFSPPGLSPEAVRVAAAAQQHHQHQHRHGTNKTASSSKQASSSSSRQSSAGAGAGAGAVPSAAAASTLTSLTSGLMRDAFKSLRDNVTSTITCIRPPAPQQEQHQQHQQQGEQQGESMRSVSSNISKYDFKDVLDEYEHALKNEHDRVPSNSGVITPDTHHVSSAPMPRALTESPGAGSSSSDSSSCIDDGPSVEMQPRQQEEQLKSAGVDAAAEAAAAAAGRQSLFDSALILSPTSRILSSFLHTHRPHLVYRLMCVVTLRSVNHENICCINSTLLILIFARRTGRLSHLMRALRLLVNSPQGSSREEEGGSDEGAGAGAGGDSELAAAVRRWRPSLPAHTRGDGLLNFRELLWYWSEYYLRRGRDRLSLEFSTHVRFQEWNSLVETLCADDGAATSLLAAPPSLPQSPYCHHDHDADRESSSNPSFTKYY